MLERLAGNKYFCFLDGFSGYFQILIDPMDQEKTTFTCPFDTYAYRRMPFGLCNASATFQRCMLRIFHDMIEESIEVFMDDFSVFGNSFDKCLNNLDKMLQHCKDAHLVLNWEKCHFMVKEVIVLGHKVSGAGLEVDKAKINVISKLPPPANIKGVRSFLGHAGFYRSDFAVGAVLGQKDGKNFHPIYFASKTLNPAQQKYTITEKELMDVVFAFYKFRSYLILSKTIVHTDHSALKHLFKKQDAKPRLIRWILLLQDFDIEIKDKKGTENVVADHLSQIDNNESSNDSEVNDNFPRETLMEVNTRNEPWFADFAKYLEEPYLFKVCSDETILRMPKALITDRGTHFCNKIIETNVKRYGVSHRFSTSYHPQTNAQVENTNRALKIILEKTVKDNPAIWSRKLDDALRAFRTTYKTPTGTTPYKLIYGKKCHFLFEIKHHAYQELKNCNPDLIATGEK
ncbi:reverse transcriptase domain-containing protein [Tanacetum coccineum]